jgi:hypothetical protein
MPAQGCVEGARSAGRSGRHEPVSANRSVPWTKRIRGQSGDPHRDGARLVVLSAIASRSGRPSTLDKVTPQSAASVGAMSAGVGGVGYSPGLMHSSQAGPLLMTIVRTLQPCDRESTDGRAVVPGTVAAGHAGSCRDVRDCVAAGMEDDSRRGWQRPPSRRHRSASP